MVHMNVADIIATLVILDQTSMANLRVAKIIVTRIIFAHRVMAVHKSSSAELGSIQLALRTPLNQINLT